jgi:hypothetical protein
MIDITAPEYLEVEVQNRDDGTSVIYVHVNGVTFFRASGVRVYNIITPVDPLEEEPPAS